MNTTGRMNCHMQNRAETSEGVMMNISNSDGFGRMMFSFVLILSLLGWVTDVFPVQPLVGDPGPQQSRNEDATGVTGTTGNTGASGDTGDLRSHGNDGDRLVGDGPVRQTARIFVKSSARDCTGC